MIDPKLLLLGPWKFSHLTGQSHGIGATNGANTVITFPQQMSHIPRLRLDLPSIDAGIATKCQPTLRDFLLTLTARTRPFGPWGSSLIRQKPPRRVRGGF